VGKLAGTSALVAGGTNAVGLATAKLFAKEGADVFITGPDESELAGAVKEIGGNITAVRADVANRADINRLVQTIAQRHGTLDLVFATAGIARYVPGDSATGAVLDTLSNIQVQELLRTVKAVLPLMPDGASILLNAFVVAVDCPVNQFSDPEAPFGGVPNLGAEIP
jgi:NADP-dependent 3-hydroxy acid dehydrogenase YdfG